MRRLALLGPAFIVGAWQFGPGNIVASSSAGAAQGYSLIWLIVASTIFALVYTDMGIRIGMIAGEKSTVQIIKEKLGNILGILAGIGVFLITLLFSVGNALGTGIGLSFLIGGGVSLWAVVASLIALALVWARHYYRHLERLMITVIALMLTAFTISAFVSRPDWGEAALGLVPGIPAETSGLLILALLGTNFSVNSAFYASYAIREKGTPRDQYRDTTLTDTLAGIVAPGVMAIMIMIAAASILWGEGRTVEEATDMARILEPVAGPVAGIIFGLGIFGAAFSSMVANATAGGSLLADAANLGNRLESKRVKALITVVLLFGATIALLFGSFPIQLIITAQALTIFVVPYLGIMMLLLANDNRRMGSLANSWWQNVLGVLGWLILVAGVVQLIRELFL
jgi:manganese transport protein